jgi:aryl-alcohol dehydrogenase-like predicted oxidoreductase
MKQRHLKSLGVSVPQIALGTVELGLPYGFGLDGGTSQPSFEQCERLLHAALDHGIRFIDTARAYGESEEVLGRCLAGRWPELVLTTKVGPLQLNGLSDAEVDTAIAQSVDRSLGLLRTDRVDWLMIHSATLSNVQQVSRLIEPIERLRQQGKIRAFGASIYDDALRTSLGVPEFQCLQTAASVIDRRVEKELARSANCGKDFIIRSVLLRGALTEKFHALPASMQPLRDAIAQLNEVATRAGLSLTELAYRYAGDFDGLMLVGTASIDELQQAIGFVDRGSLSSDVLAEIRSMDCLEDRFLNPAQWPKFEATA